MVLPTSHVNAALLEVASSVDLFLVVEGSGEGVEVDLIVEVEAPDTAPIDNVGGRQVGRVVGSRRWNLLSELLVEIVTVLIESLCLK